MSIEIPCRVPAIGVEFLFYRLTSTSSETFSSIRDYLIISMRSLLVRILAILVVLGGLSCRQQRSDYVRHVETAADLVALPIENSSNCFSVFLKGRVVANDGGGGIFVYDSASMAATNRGTVFKPVNAPGRWRRQYEGNVRLNWFGVDPTGTLDQTDIIQNAIDMLPQNGGIIEIPAGTFLLNRPLDINNKLHVVLNGVRSAYQDMLSVFWVKYNRGFVFSIASKTTNTSLTLSNLEFDGSNGRSGDVSQWSDVWPGLYTNSVSSWTGLRIEECWIHRSRVPNTAALYLNGGFDLRVFDSKIEAFPNGRLFYAQRTGQTSTTLKFRDSYLRYAREIGFLAGTTDANFDNTIFESSVVALASIGCKARLNGCYFENLGSDQSRNSYTNGLTFKNMGINFDDGLSAQVDCVITDLYSEYTFLSCTFNGVSGSLQAWFQGIGRGSEIGQNGGAIFINCHSSSDSVPFFSNEGKQQYIYNVWDTANGSGIVMRHSDARLITDGLVTIPFPRPDLRRTVKVARGRFIYGYDPEVKFESGLTSSPVNGTNLVGDIVLFTAPDSSNYLASVCTVSGNPGTWMRVNQVQNSFVPDSVVFADSNGVPQTASAVYWISSSNRLSVGPKSLLGGRITVANDTTGVSPLFSFPAIAVGAGGIYNQCAFPSTVFDDCGQPANQRVWQLGAVRSLGFGLRAVDDSGSSAVEALVVNRGSKNDLTSLDILNSGLRLRRNAKAGDYQISKSDFYIFSSGTSTKILPDAGDVGEGTVIQIKSGIGATTKVKAVPGDTVDGVASFCLEPLAAAQFISDGVNNWECVSMLPNHRGPDGAIAR